MKNFLEANGCHVKVERGNRVFPVSDRASDVTSAFARRLRELRVKVELNQGVRELWLEDGVLLVLYCLEWVSQKYLVAALNIQP